MPSASPSPSNRASSRLRRGVWLGLLALLLALHPAAGAGEGSSSGLASVLRALLCGCAECAGDVEPLAQAAPTCCGHGSESPQPRDAGCQNGGACTCSHPDRVPMPDDCPLGAPTGSGASSDLLAQLAAECGVAQRTPCPPGLSALPPGVSVLEPGDVFAPGRRLSARPVGALTTGVRLARLSKLLL